MKRKFSEKIFYTTFLRFQPAGRYEHEVSYCSYVILCQRKCETTNHELYRKHKVDLSDIPFVKDQFNLIPNELSDEFDGVPVAIANQGYSYHLWGDINDEVQT